MLTRRKLHIVMVALGAMILSRRAVSEQGDMVTVRIRADESVRAIMPPIAQENLKIEPDQSEDAKELARRSPETRAAPIMLIIVGAIAVTELAQMIREMLRQVYYGGVVIDTRSQPPSVSSSPRIPADTVFVIEADGKTSRYTRDQFSLDVLKLALQVK
jgi:hypothetical protein